MLERRVVNQSRGVHKIRPCEEGGVATCGWGNLYSKMTWEGGTNSNMTQTMMTTVSFEV